MVDIIGLIKEAFSAVGSYFGYLKQRDAEKNTAAVQAGKERQQEQQVKDDINKTIQEGSDEEIRKRLAE